MFSTSQDTTPPTKRLKYDEGTDIQTPNGSIYIPYDVSFVILNLLPDFGVHNVILGLEEYSNCSTNM